MSKTLSKIGEFGLIDRLKKQIGRSSSVVKGIGDDTAVVPLSSQKYLLLTADMLVEGVHFTTKMPARAIGHKALACSISDIAAMGGIAKYALVSLGVPPSCPVHMILSIYQGMNALAKKFNVSIVGGDTVKNGKIIINVTLIGEVNKNELICRKGASRGDSIFVTGPLGRSLSSGWHARFTPRMAQSQFLVRHYKPSAMIDISDGLAADLGHILDESRVGAILDGPLIPRRPKARLNNALYDGEDFELLFTVSPLQARKLKRSAAHKFTFFCIGEIVDRKKGLQLRVSDGTLTTIHKKGYTHF
jgi:thiamine-monophosphate kinase